MSRILERKPRILLGACGKRSGRLMEWMAQQIVQDDLGEIIRGNFDGNNSSEMIFQHLLNSRNSGDFAVMFITHEKESEISLEISREIAILSAGLFIGEVGLQPQRFIMVSSVPVSNFLSNVCEMIQVKIDEPPGFFAYGNSEIEDWCDTKLQPALHSLIQCIEKNGPYLPKPVLNVFSKSELAARVHFGEENVTKYERIFSASHELTSPDNFSIARAVARNICWSDFDYSYYFSMVKADTITDVQRWIDFLRVVIAAFCMEVKPEGTDIDLEDNNIQTYLKNQEEDAIKAIEQLRKHMNIYIKKFSIPFDLVILTSATNKNACYLHQGDCFIEWKSVHEVLAARDIVKRDINSVKKDSFFQVDDPQILEVIKSSINNLFAQCGDEVLNKIRNSCL